jgi:hypothetical protein
MKKLFFFLFSMVLLTACQKPEDRSCLKSTGKEIVDTVFLPNFAGLYLKQNIEFYLVPDTSNFAVLKGGEHLLKKITFTPKDSSLLIQNENKCNFLRSYKKHIYVEIHFKKLHRLEFLGSFDLHCADTIQTDMFNLLQQKGSATVYLKLNTNYCNAEISEGVGNFFLYGNGNYVNLILQDQSYCDASNFVVHNLLFADNRSEGDMICNAGNGKINVSIGNKGSIYFYGAPQIGEVTIHGDGQLIKK